MVNALGIIAAAERAGARFEIDGERLRVSPASVLDAEMREQIMERRIPIIAHVRRRREVVFAAAALLREGRWPQTPPVCEFQIGYAGGNCRRCGASWMEHYPAPTRGTP